MVDNKILYAILIFLLTFLTVLIMTLFIIKSKSKKTKIKLVKNKSRWDDFWLKTYNLLCKFYITQNYLQKIRKRIEIYELSDNWTITRKTMKVSFFALSLCAILFLILVFMGLNLYYFLVSVTTIFVIHNQIIKILVDRMEDKLLWQFDKFLGDVRHHYHEHAMIDEAVYDSIEESYYEMSMHANKMYEILTSNDTDAELEKYSDCTPNKYFVTFLAICTTVQKFSDKIVEGKSIFLSNLENLKEEINIELLRRKKLDYLFKSLSIIAIMPIFSLKPLESWGVSNLPEMSEYFDGSSGFAALIAVSSASLLSYQLICRMQENSKYSDVQDSILESILKIGFIKVTINFLKNRQYNKAVKLTELMKMSGVHGKVDCFYLKRLLYLVFGFVICLLLFFNMHSITRYNILNKTEDIFKDVQNIDKNTEKILLKADRDFIYKNKGKSLSYQQIQEELIRQNIVTDKRLAEIMAKGIYDKMSIYNNNYFRWWELLVCIALGAVFYNLPYWFLLFRKWNLKMNMEDEVMQFHTIIIMLMHIDRISVEDILKWMEQFAVIFKDSISKCFDNFENGDFEALEQLKLDEPYLPLVRIVENLQAATNKIPIVQAFDELKSERGYYKEKRKIDNDVLINRKGILGKIIAFIPLGAAIFLYLLLPFLQISISQLQSYSEEIKNII